jgi:tetratricopeptide (TPR) repeat protein
MNRISACLLFLVMGCSSCGVRAQGSHEPLGETQLLALVAGAALPENIVAAIRDRGVSFTSDADFRAKLEAVGADPRTLEALDTAKVIVPAGAKEVPNKEVQKRILDMATQYKSEKFPDDPTELLAVIKDALGSPESGFVMGQMLRQQELFPQAEYVYGEVLSDNPNFPEAHTKLSYILHRLEEEEAALREAKAALMATPDNAEAHKNAGLALAAMRKFDAADAEYEAALRGKPDYEAVRYDLGLMYSLEGDVNGAIAQYRKAIALDPSDVDARYNRISRGEAAGPETL